MNAEVTTQHVYLGTWDYLNLLNRANVHLHFKLGKYFSFFAGPAFSVYYSEQTAAIPGYKLNIRSASSKKIDFSDRVKGWFGFNAGINIF